jgi:hypothetical protein
MPGSMAAPFVPVAMFVARSIPEPLLHERPHPALLRQPPSRGPPAVANLV